MENISTSFLIGKQNSDSYNEDHKDENLFLLPFSEYEILKLQAMFVTPGIHTIQVKNIGDGRTIIKTILNSLNFYRNVGFIAHGQDVSYNAYDIMHYIQHQKTDRTNFAMHLENFITLHPCFDFIWIEYCENIKNLCSLDDIKKIFNMYHAEERMPILLIQYEAKLRKKR